MIQLQEISYAIGQLELLRAIKWNVQPGKRAALVGPNGAGKTTLLRVLAGEITDFSGQIVAPRGYRIGYLPQEETVVGEGDILPLVLAGHREVAALEQQIVDIHHAMESADNLDALLKKLGPLEERFRQMGGYDLEIRAKTILSGLGFSESDFERPVAEFSGGWRMRVYLARLLVTEPDLLLMDEPTNHLDIESLEWLEQYLASFPGSLILVSHDRYFIDRLAQEIVELDAGRLTRYTGNYSQYEVQKKAAIEQQIKAFEAQQEEIQRIERFIERFRYKATKAAQVQSRIKQLEKIERLERPTAQSVIRFKLASENPSHKDVMTMKDMAFRYDDPWVLEDVNLNLYRSERVALVGVNGAGKTTLTRLMTGELNASKGEVLLGGNVSVGYYAQHQIDALNSENTVLQEVMASSGYSELQIRKILGVFHFSGDTVDKSISVLSGGEKARVSLAKMLARPSNFIIMDEPTNHLDMSSKAALTAALQDYDGTLLIISHDRHFLDKLVTRVWELKDGTLRVYEGNYSDYLHLKTLNQGVSDTAEPVSAGTETAAQSGIRKSKEQKRLEAEQRQKYSKERQVVQKEVSRSEAVVERLEEEKAMLEEQLADAGTYSDPVGAAELQKRYKVLGQELGDAYNQWEEAQKQLEDILERMNSL